MLGPVLAPVLKAVLGPVSRTSQDQSLSWDRFRLRSTMTRVPGSVPDRSQDWCQVGPVLGIHFLCFRRVFLGPKDHFLPVASHAGPLCRRLGREAEGWRILNWRSHVRFCNPPPPPTVELHANPVIHAWHGKPTNLHALSWVRRHEQSGTGTGQWFRPVSALLLSVVRECIAQWFDFC